MVSTIIIYGDRAASGRQADADKTWPIILYRRLVLRLKENLTFANFSLPEETTDQISRRFTAEAEILPANLKEFEQIYTVFCLGQNDAKHITKDQPNRVGLEQFKINVKKIIEVAKKNDLAPIFLGPTPVKEEILNTSYSRVYYLNAEIAQYNQALAQLCQDNDVIYFDIFNQWFGQDYSTLLNEDGLHPSYAGHRKIFEVIAPLFGLNW